MPDLATVSTVLTSIKTAAGLAKMLKDSDVSLEKAETQFKLAELISALADAKIEIADIQELILEKDKTISDLEKALEIKGNLMWEPPNYFLEAPELPERKDGPYCQQCQDNHQKLIRLQKTTAGLWQCMTCKTIFTPPDFYRASTD